MRVIGAAVALMLSGCTLFGEPHTEHPNLNKEVAREIVDMDCDTLLLTRRALDAIEDGVVVPADLPADAAAAYARVKDLSPEAQSEAQDLARHMQKENTCALRR
ncbi:MAG: hypothetical protein AAFQ36_12595 [Pseudomonadota bacterium]